MIDRAMAERVLGAALDNGADYAELFMEDSETNNLELTDGRVEKATSARTHGAGVRVLLGARSAYAYTSDTDEAELMKTARAAAAALPGNGRTSFAPFVPHAYETPMEKPFQNVENDARVQLIRSAAAAAKSVSNEISQVVTGYLDKVQRVLIANSEGRFVTDVRPRTRAYVRAVAMAGAEAQTGFEGPGCSMGFEAYKRAIDFDASAREAAKTAVTMLHARECPAGFMPVVIDGGFGGVIFHEACGHSLESTSVGRGNSEFCGRLGEKIAADCVTAIDDGTIPNAWGSINVDDEGNAPQRNVLIENGVLTGYLIDKLGGRQLDMPATGSARRQSYCFAPTSRMTNTYIAEGADDDEEMISSLDSGLYARKMGGGSVNPATGEFNFAVSEGYLIENGRIACPVRGATLVGKGADILLKIDRVGRNRRLGQGMCGSISGLIPVNVGQPRIRVSGITVGGKGGVRE